MAGLRYRPARPCWHVLLQVALVAWLGLPAIAVALPAWQVTREPTSIEAGVASEIIFTVTNLGSSDTSDLIGCVTMGVDPALTVSGIRVVSASAGKSWTASAPTPTTVTARATLGNDRLTGGALMESMSFGITVAGTVAGTYTLAADSYWNVNCSSGLSSASVQVTVLGSAPTPTPTPTPSPTPSPTPIAAPSPTPTAAPSPTPTAAPSPTPTAAPSPSPSPSPSPTPVPSPVETPSPPTPAPTSKIAIVVPDSPSASGPPASADPSTAVEPTATLDRSEPPAVAKTAEPGGSVDATSPGPPGAGHEEPVFRVPNAGSGTVDLAGIELAAVVIRSLGILRWAVPGFVFSVPGLLVIVAVLVQIGGGLVWLPLVRRKIGSIAFRGIHAEPRA